MAVDVLERRRLDANDRRRPAYPIGPPELVALVAVLGCAVLRLWVLTRPVMALDADEAVTGLMVHRILAGSGYVFFAGQSYMGSLEQYLQAAFLTVLPATPFTLRLAQVLLSTVACLLVFLVGRRLFADRWRPALAAVLFAVGPAFSVLWSAKSRGAYDVIQVVGLLGMLFALRGSRRSRSTDRRLGWAAFGLGVCCGLGLWLSVAAALLLLPAAVWFLGDLRGAARRLAPALAGVVLGALPVAVWVVVHRALPRIDAQPPSTLGQRVGGLLDPVFGQFLGLTAPDRRRVLPLAGTLAVAAVLAVCWGVAAWRRRRGLLDLATARRARRQPVDLLILAVGVTVALYLASPTTWYTREPRYLFPAYPLLALGLAGLVPPTRRAGTVVGGLLLVAVTALSAGTLLRLRDSGPVHRSADFAAATAALRAEGITRVYGDYWSGLPMDYLEYGRLIVAPLDAHVRFPDLRRTVDAAPRTAYVVSAAIRPRLAAAFDEANVHYRVADFGSEVVFTDLHGGYRPAQIGAPPWSPAG